jgi:hypothetical protein
MFLLMGAENYYTSSKAGLPSDTTLIPNFMKIGQVVHRHGVTPAPQTHRMHTFLKKQNTLTE